jgi:26S proteasome regulatory subunit N13
MALWKYADLPSCSAAPAPTDAAAAAAVANFLRSLQGNPNLTGQPQQEKPFTTLPDLLQPATTISVIDSAPVQYIDSLLRHLPPVLLLLAQEIDDISSVDPTPETAAAALEALSLSQKRDILHKVLRSPQFSQSLGSLTMALRDGGLPSISDALGIKVENGGFMRRGGMPLGGGEAVEAFLAGIKKAVKDEEGKMDTN